jgi:hypothetical protein
MAITGRLYTVGFAGVAVSAAQDLIAVYAGTSRVLGIASVNLGQITGTTVQNLRVRLRYLPVTVTAGSVGSAGTIAPMVPNDSASGATARINDTTQATTSGTAVNIWDDAWNTVNGLLWVPPTPNRMPVIGISGAFIVSLDTAPSGALTCSGSVTFEELP